MKGKLTLAVFAAIILILTVPSPLRDRLHYELNLGRVVTLEDVYEIAPYEVARLAEIKLKAECPDCVIIYYPKTKRLAIADNPYVATKYEWVEGRAIEKIGKDLYRFIYVRYDEERSDYFTLSVDLPVNVSGKYIVDFEIPSYLKIVTVGKGQWYAGELSGPLEVSDIYNPNEVDWEIIDAIAAQFREYAEKHNLSNREVVKLVCDMIPLMIRDHDPSVKYPGEPCDATVYENSSMVDVKLNVSDSIVKRILLEGGACWQHAIMDAWILKALGYDTGTFGYWIREDMPHAVLAMLESDKYTVLKKQYAFRLQWGENETLGEPITSTLGFVNDFPIPSLEEHPKLLLWRVKKI